jgi:hypothetical protein
MLNIGVSLPLEVSSNGQLPDGSIVFVDNTPPVIPEEPEVSNCSYDLAGTLFAEIAGYGEIAQVKFNKGNRIANGTRGKLMMVEANASYYEICMNGEQPIPFVAETVWENGDCKYNSGLGFDASRNWIDSYAFDDPSVKLFMSGSLGSYESRGFLSRGTPGVIIPSEWTDFPTGGIVMTNSEKIVYRGYQYSKGKLIDTREDSDQTDPSIKRDLYYYEICRSKI